MAVELDRNTIWASRIRRVGDRLGGSRGLVVEGKLTRMVGKAAFDQCQHLFGDRIRPKATRRRESPWP